MSEILKFSIAVFAVVVVSLIFTDQAQAANVTFTSDVQLDFTNVPSTVYINTGSACDSFTVSTSTLTADIPTGSTFTLETAAYTVLSLTPSGGTVTLSFDTSYFSTGYVTQWTASGSVAAVTVNFTVGVPGAKAYYLVKVDGVNLGYYVSDDSRLISFSYTGGFSNRVFTITQETPSWALPIGGGGVPADVTAPAISQIAVTVASDQATISWKTDESSISWLLYGTSTAYGLEIKTTTSTLSHPLTLTNLSASTTYHYQIKSKDSAGNIGSLTDQTFTTLAPGVAPEIIVKPIAEMTIEELKAEITRITALISQLQAQLAELQKVAPAACSGITFEINLKQGTSGNDVKCLQALLNQSTDTQVATSGAGSPGNETSFFGPKTKAAVVKFQEKYASEILAPLGLEKGTGYVGQMTKAKINEFLGR